MRRLLATLAAAVLLLSGCDIYSLPLPGGADTGDDPMQVEVEFRDVLDLVPHSQVKVNDVTVGKVTAVDLDENGGPGRYKALVTVELPGDTDLPQDTQAKIRQTSLLGEKFVSLEAPETGAGQLADGDTIPLARTGRNTELEEVFGALSLILNGGGVAQLKSIAKELNTALDGNEDSARSVLNQLESFMGQLDANKADIVQALESVNGLAVTARRHMGSIDAAMDELPSALRSIDRQRDDLVRMLRALNRLSGVGTRVIRSTKQSTIRALRSLQPVLTSMADSGDALVNSLHSLVGYPIPDTAFGRNPNVARNLHSGDYINLHVDLRIKLEHLLGGPPGSGNTRDSGGRHGGGPGNGDLPLPDDLDDTTGGLLDKLGGLGSGLGRPGFSTRDGQDGRSPDAGALDRYDPALVGVLATPLVVEQP